MNGFHLLVMGSMFGALSSVLVIASPTTACAQSIIESELSRTTLASAVDAAGRTTLTASVTAERGGGVPGGIIRFVDESTLALLGWTDVAHPSIVVERLTAGVHRLRASYGGTAEYLPMVIQPSQSALLLQTVRAVPDVALSSSDDACAPGAVVTLTATTASRDGVPSGAVTFRDGDAILAAHVGLDRSGLASFTTSALANGARTITAEYEGDTRHAPAASPRLVLDVGTPRARNSQRPDAD